MLSQTLKRLIIFEDVDIDTFWPKCYHLNNEEDYFDFVNHFLN